MRPASEGVQSALAAAAGPRSSARRAPRPTPLPEESLATAVAACHGVAGLSGGAFGEVATYLEGRRVSGVRLTDEAVEVHVVAQWGVPLREVAQEVRAACARVIPGRRVDVTFDDVDIDDPAPQPARPRPARRPRTTHPA